MYTREASEQEGLPSQPLIGDRQRHGTRTTLSVFMHLLGIKHCLLLLVIINLLRKVASLRMGNAFGGKYEAPTKSIFEFEVAPITGGEPVSLANYKGKKAYLIVNVASK